MFFGRRTRVPAESGGQSGGVAEQIAHLLRMRRGGDVEVLGPLSDHQIAHPASDEIGKMSCPYQAIKDP